MRLLIVILVLFGAADAKQNSVPVLSPEECGCPNETLRVRITITHGASLCLRDGDEISGDVRAVCYSRATANPKHCKVVEGCSDDLVLCGKQKLPNGFISNTHKYCQDVISGTPDHDVE